MKVNSKPLQILSLVLLMSPAIAQAHPVFGASLGFFGGLLHQLTSLEHVLVMMMVGLCFVQIDSKRMYLLPVVFVGMMLVGGTGAVLGFELQHIENALAVAWVLMGLTFVVRRKISALLGLLITTGFALFYGYTHAGVMLLDVDATAYSAGFAFASLLLNTLGVVLGLLIKRFSRQNLLPYLGGLVTLTGGWLMALE